MTEVVPLRIIPGVALDALDQTLLPAVEQVIRIRDLDALCVAVRELRVRGAPLLGIVGAAGMAIAAQAGDASDTQLRQALQTISAVRPTAVELSSIAREALDSATASGPTPDGRREALWAFAQEHYERRLREDRATATFGAALLPAGASVLTHCNTGALATGGIGTALGVIRVAWESGKLKRCYATETRPLLQGARLTMWELAKLGIPATLLPDTAAASLIASGSLDAVITGADRIAANGDTANKIGTYGLAAVAARHGVPFYIAAPTSTIDPACKTGASIPIEFRDAREVGGFAGLRWSPDGGAAYNPAFDVTPAELIAAIITEKGALVAPYRLAIAGALGQR
ncbi:MAG: S-methyl-5-thioribose-1-phosphate isomerase [Tepidiformaceae bacterium]